MSTNPGTRQPIPTFNPPITTAELQAWITRRERFRRRLKTVLAAVLVLGIGGVVTFWSLFHDQLMAIGSLRAHRATVNWDWDFKTIWQGGETDVSYYIARWGWSQDHRFDADQLKPLASLLHLKSLSLSGVTGLHDNDLAILEKLPELIHLQLDRPRDHEGKKQSGLNDDTLEYVKGLTHLQTLVLTDNNITDAGVAKLANLQELEMLDLDGTHITDASLDVFKKLKKLRMLNVVGTGITKAAAAKFRSEMTLIELTSEEIAPGPPNQ